MFNKKGISFICHKYAAYNIMNKRPGFNCDKLKRVHRKELLFNTSEMEVINVYCKRYKIRNQSKFLREAIISRVLNKFENDHPKLF